jgi:hypothetical protein
LKNLEHVSAFVRRAGVVEDLAGGDVHGGEEIGRAVALVVMGHGPGPSGLERKSGLGAVECLDLGLLVEAEDDGPFGRAHVEPDHVDELLFEVRVVRDLEGHEVPGSQVVVPPDPGHGVLADPESLGERPSRPLSRAIVGEFFSRHAHYLGHGAFGQPRTPAPSRCNRADPVGPALFETPSRAAHRVRGHVQASRDLVVGLAIGGKQQRLGLHDRAVRLGRRTCDALELVPLFAGHVKWRCGPHHGHVASLITSAISATDH